MKAQTWSKVWVAMWAVNMAVLIPLAFIMALHTWLVLVLFLFAVPEIVGIKGDDAFPPLTHVIHRYLPRWLTFVLIYGLVGAVGAVWFRFTLGVAWRFGGMLMLLGWLSDHFTEIYEKDRDGPPEEL